MKGIIFSFDNVLCETNYLHKKALYGALKEHGYYWSNEMEKGYEKVDDSPTRSRLNYLINSKQIRQEDAELVEYTTLSLASDMIAECKFSEKVFEQLENLKHRGIQIAVASNCHRNTVINFLKWTRLNELVDFVTTVDNGDFKPDPSVYIRTLQKMKLDPKLVTVFEGTYYGTVAAKLAGIENVRETSNRNLESSLRGFERAYFK